MTVVVGNEVVAQEHFRKGFFDVGLIEAGGDESVKNLGVCHGAACAEHRVHKVVRRHELLIWSEEFRARAVGAAPIKDERIGHKIGLIEQLPMKTRCDGLVEGFLPKESRRCLDELALSVGYDPLLLKVAPSCGIWTHEIGVRACGGRLEREHAELVGEVVVKKIDVFPGKPTVGWSNPIAIRQAEPQALFGKHCGRVEAERKQQTFDLVA